MKADSHFHGNGVMHTGCPCGDPTPAHKKTHNNVRSLRNTSAAFTACGDVHLLAHCYSQLHVSTCSLVHTSLSLLAQGLHSHYDTHHTHRVLQVGPSGSKEHPPQAGLTQPSQSLWETLPLSATNTLLRARIPNHSLV